MANNCGAVESHSISCDEVYEALPALFCRAEVAEHFEACYNTVKKRIWVLEEEGDVERLNGTDIWQRNSKG
ncbi:hypothetical protein SAMN05216285_1522 [Natrinema salifodinae]|uniref:Uncharacterized protein n=1 Tax=Natrinema salifodinae TaxID=1202768 RepID=A0A1I0NCK2_9EURY|nr:hypothetical protein SAMN05216285_1522 [Natrinema salifodinae]